MEEVLNYGSFVFNRAWQIILWILALPLNLFASFLAWIKARRYDPEKIVCPACGFKGDDRANGYSCWIRFERVDEPNRGIIRHTCFRCGCNEIYSKPAYPVEKWLAKELPRRQVL